MNRRQETRLAVFFAGMWVLGLPLFLNEDLFGQGEASRRIAAVVTTVAWTAVVAVGFRSQRAQVIKGNVRAERLLDQYTRTTVGAGVVALLGFGAAVAGVMLLGVPETSHGRLGLLLIIFGFFAFASAPTPAESVLRQKVAASGAGGQPGIAHSD